MSKTPKDIKLAQIFDAKNTIMSIYQRNKSGLSNSAQSLNDLYTLEYIGKKLNAPCKADISRIRKAGSDYMNGILSEKSYEILLRGFAKKYKMPFPDLSNGTYKKVSTGNSLNNIFSSPSKNSSRLNKVSMNSFFKQKKHSVSKRSNVSMKKLFGGF